jgi:hypothetical protein
MRTSSGFDRLSTEEELHQVLAVLQGVSRNGWVVYEEDSTESQETLLSADTVLAEDDSIDAECLSQLVAKRPELKN